MFDIVVIGGGASGFFAAINAAETKPGLKIAIFEKSQKVLQKVKISGGGRCNVTHACFVPRELVKNYPRGAKELRSPFSRFACGDTMEWYERHGVPTKIEEDGRIFPESNTSQTIVDCLRNTAQKLGVVLHTGQGMKAIFPPNEEQQHWEIQVGEERVKTHQLCLATGSSPAVWKLLKQLDIPIIDPVPSLFTFNIKDPRIKDLPGLSVPKAQVKIQGSKLKSEGPLLITHWGLSGPAILRLSAWGAVELAAKKYEFGINVNWIGAWTQQEILEELLELQTEKARKTIAKNAEFGLPTRLWQSLVKAAGIGLDIRWADLPKKLRNRLCNQLTQCEFQVAGKSTFKDEFVTAGGVDLKSIDFKRFESKLYPGLFIIGEMLNIDAVTGGFNFQAAWTGGYIAGQAMAGADR